MSDDIPSIEESSWCCSAKGCFRTTGHKSRYCGSHMEEREETPEPINVMESYCQDCSSYLCDCLLQKKIESLETEIERLKKLVSVESPKAKEPANLPNSDIQDPYFSTRKVEAPDVLAICALATTIYKNIEMLYQIQPVVYNLLASVDFETLKTAIQRASEYTSPEHKYRLGFAKQFPTAEAVRQWAKRPETAPQTAQDGRSAGGMDDNVREFEKLQKERGIVDE